MKARSIFEVNTLLKVVKIDCLSKVRGSPHFERFYVEGSESMRNECWDSIVLVHASKGNRGMRTCIVQVILKHIQSC